MLLRSNEDGRQAADQLPSPCTILEVPPALTASSAPSSSPPPAGSALQDSTSDVHQQQHQRADVAAGHQHPQHVPPHVMSGRRLDRRYDIPVNLGFLDGYVDHAPALGSGRLDVILGPMFAGKTTALLQRVSEEQRGVVVGGGRLCVCGWLLVSALEQHVGWSVGGWACSQVPAGFQFFSVFAGLLTNIPPLPACLCRHPLLQLGGVVAGRPFICVKSSKDTRYSDHWIMTHGGGCVRCLPFHSLAEFKAHMSFRWRKIQVGAV